MRCGYCLARAESPADSPHWLVRHGHLGLASASQGRAELFGYDLRDRRFGLAALCARSHTDDGVQTATDGCCHLVADRLISLAQRASLRMPDDGVFAAKTPNLQSRNLPGKRPFEFLRDILSAEVGEVQQMLEHS